MKTRQSPPGTAVNLERKASLQGEAKAGPSSQIPKELATKSNRGRKNMNFERLTENTAEAIRKLDEQIAKCTDKEEKGRLKN